MELLVDYTGAGTTTVDAEGSWAITTTITDPGKYVLGLNALDMDGNLLSASDPQLITIPVPEPEEVDASEELTATDSITDSAAR